MNDILLYFSIKYYGNWDKIFNALEKKEKPTKEEIEYKVKNFTTKYITILDGNYPKQLKDISKPPFVIFYKGNISMLKDLEKKSIVWPFGSYVNKYVHEISNDISKEKILYISGYTDVFEKTILSINSKKNLIFVKDCGIDSQLIMDETKEEKILKNDNLIISEYPGFVVPTNETWKESNKIKISLSKGIFLVNSIKHSNLFSIIADVIESGKEVYCLKNKKDDSNNHNNILIEKGALLIKNVIQLKK